ncbi:hypothetical protein EON67_07695 [archaeon]|nr:MAG: hypothetical protein EON67_07695 [archaeon]
MAVCCLFQCVERDTSADDPAIAAACPGAGPPVAQPWPMLLANVFTLANNSVCVRKACDVWNRLVGVVDALASAAMNGTPLDAAVASACSVYIQAGEAFFQQAVEALCCGRACATSVDADVLLTLCHMYCRFVLGFRHSAIAAAEAGPLQPLSSALRAWLTSCAGEAAVTKLDDTLLRASSERERRAAMKLLLQTVAVSSGGIHRPDAKFEGSALRIQPAHTVRDLPQRLQLMSKILASPTNDDALDAASLTGLYGE